jgi:hypothetical protein
LLAHTYCSCSVFEQAGRDIAGERTQAAHAEFIRSRDQYEEKRKEAEPFRKMRKDLRELANKQVCCAFANASSSISSSVGAPLMLV